MASQLYTLSNPVFASYAFYAAVVILKMFLLAPLTTLQRFANKAFSNPEDQGRSKVLSHDSVERVRRNHLNDVENIPAFLALGLLYVAISPSPSTALWHFRVFAIARILHTISYQFKLQPHRLITFLVSILVSISMAVQIIAATVF